MTDDAPHLVLYTVDIADLLAARAGTPSANDQSRGVPSDHPVTKAAVAGAASDGAACGGGGCGGGVRAGVAGRAVRLPAFSPEQLQRPFPVTFEQAADSLERLPRMYFEPDGSFVWVGDSGLRSGGGDPAADDTLSGPWQLDGQLQEAAGRVLHVELKGDCPAEQFRQLLAALGSDEQPVVGQLVRDRCFVDAREWFGLERASRPPLERPAAENSECPVRAPSG